MRRPRVKICGIIRSEDAAIAVSLGASAIGFVLWPTSPRAISVADARAIAQDLPPFITRVGVFVNASPEEVALASRAIGLDIAQLHGDEDPSRYAGTCSRLLKAVALADGQSVDAAEGLPTFVTPLVDAGDPDRRGGTGRTADWELAAILARRRPIVLAGGLTAENVAEAVRRVRPWAVDVSSGVEATPGVKSAVRLKMFFAALARVEETAL